MKDIRQALTLYDLLYCRKHGLDPLAVQNTARNLCYKDDYAGFRKAILDERRWELALEGSRWFDLVRLSTDFAQTVKRVKPNAYPEEKHKLFPIPQYERLLNGKITQNDGY